MKKDAYISIGQNNIQLPPIDDEFAADALALFTQKHQGHMGQWEYGPALFPGDPAGGGTHWATLVKEPGNYYITLNEIKTISWAIQQEKLQNLLEDAESVVELGPGSYEAIANKTVPFLKICPSLSKYISIDATSEQANDAARIVQEKLSLATGVRNQEFMGHPLAKVDSGKSVLTMWGTSLGNISGCAGEECFSKLVDLFSNFRHGLKSSDIIVISIDTESDEQKIINAYHEPALRQSILSTLYRLKRDGYVTGNFDPRVWQHEAVWYKDVRQCAHTVYPIVGQSFRICDQQVEIPAWHRLIANNSYKFSPSKAEAAALAAGFIDPFCLQNDGPIALLVATHP